MMLVGARGVVSASHSLPQHPSPHGHTYEIWVYVPEGECAETLQGRVYRACKFLDHRCLNDALPGDPTMENIARFIAAHIPEAKEVTVSRPIEGLLARYMP